MPGRAHSQALFLAPDQGVTHQEVRAKYRPWHSFDFPQNVNAEVKCPTDLKECRTWHIARHRVHPILHP
jgi:hypothetical protein